MNSCPGSGRLVNLIQSSVHASLLQAGSIKNSGHGTRIYSKNGGNFMFLRKVQNILRELRKIFRKQIAPASYMFC